MKTPASNANAARYTLSSDLARLCLPQEFKDANRRLAWANSVCLLFLLIGIVGLKPPRIKARQQNLAADIVPVVIVPEVEPPKPMQPDTPKELEPLDRPRLDQPNVATVVATDPKSVAFPVPVPGPVILAPARFASAPKFVTPAFSTTPTATRYIPSEADWGGHAGPEYPLLAKRRGYQGKVVLEIVVAPSGEISSVKVRESSGYQVLDDTALEHVRRHLRLRTPPGETRLHTIDIIFQLKP